MGKEWEEMEVASTNCTKVLRQKKKKNVATGQGTKKSVWQEPSNQGKKKASEWRGSQEPYHTGPHRSFKQSKTDGEPLILPRG